MTDRSSDERRKLLEEAWRKLYASEGFSRRGRLSPHMPSFVDYAWGNFNPKTVLTILMSGDECYPALKPILFSGLCTWVVCPTRRSLRQHGMLLVGIDHLRKAEEKARYIFSGSDLPNHELFGDIIGRIAVLGQDFFSDFYHPIGGIAQVLRSTTPGNFYRSLAKHSEAARTAVTMMEVYDYHAKHLTSSNRYYQPSEGKGYKLVRLIDGRHRRLSGISVEISEDRWRKLRLYQTASLIYAASTLPVDDNCSLFDAICAGTATFEKHGQMLPQWAARARYAAEVILHDFTKPEVGQENANWLPDVQREPTPEPKLSADERKEIDAQFDRVEILRGRLKTQKQLTVNKQSKRILD